MLKQTNFLLLSIIIIGTLLASCEKTKSLLTQIGLRPKPSGLSLVDFGEVQHYQPFLWRKGNAPVVETTLVLKFNQEAIAKNSSITLQLQDEQGKNISPANHQASLLIDGKSYPDGNHTLQAGLFPPEKEIRVGLRFHDQAPEGPYKGLITVASTDLDRVNDTQEPAGKQIMEWRADYQVIMNPLKFWLLVILGCLLLLLLLRLTVLKRKLHPTFSGTIRSFASPTQGRMINFNGHRQVVLVNKVPRQSLFDKIWRGKILYVADPLFTSPIVFTPSKRGRIKCRYDANQYAFHPSSDGFLHKGIEYKIKETKTNSTVKI